MVFLLVLRELGWRALSATELMTHYGRTINLCQLAPAAAAALAKEAAWCLF